VSAAGFSDRSGRRGPPCADLPAARSRFALTLAWLVLAGLLWVLFGIAPVFADEQIFGYLYVTDTLPQGKLELEQWATANFKQSQGSYLGLPLRTEIEYGITDRFQASLYLNYSYLNANRNGVEGQTSGPGVPENADPWARYRRFRYDSVSAEFIYRLLSPYKDPIGLALYLEPAWGPRESEIETRLLLQKNFLDDRLVLAANLQWEWEWEKQTGDPGLPADDLGASPRTERETTFEAAVGASWMFAPRWRAGVEYRNVNHWAGAHNFSAQNKEWQASFLGPNVHYASERWWITLTALAQLPTAHAYNDEYRENIVDGRVYGNAATRYAVRMRLGFWF
jgi:hypothetical protein